MDEAKFVMIDLHTHTTMSDGQYTPAELVNMAERKNITILSITDHDTVSGLVEGENAAKNAGITFVPGIEISVKGNRELHILGYCIDANNAELIKMCNWFEKQRIIRQKRILDYLNTKGIELTAEDVEKHVAHGRIGRPHFARAMVEKGYVYDYREAFDRYLGTPEFDTIERPKPMPQEGIETIRNAGGVAVLAHPSQLKLNSVEIDKLVKDLVSYGLEGIECYYSTHTKEQTDYYLSLAEKHRLIATGGSDFHGEKVKPDIELGTGINNSLSFKNENIARELNKRSKGE